MSWLFPRKVKKEMVVLAHYTCLLAPSPIYCHDQSTLGSSQRALVGIKTCRRRVGARIPDIVRFLRIKNSNLGNISFDSKSNRKIAMISQKIIDSATEYYQWWIVTSNMSSSLCIPKDEDNDPHPNDEPPSVIQNVEQRRSSSSFNRNFSGALWPGGSSSTEGSSLGSSRFADASGDANTANAMSMNTVGQTLYSAQLSSGTEGSALGSSRFADASGDAYKAHAKSMNSVGQTLYSAQQRPVDLLSSAQQQQQQQRPDLAGILNIGPNLNTHQTTARIDQMTNSVFSMSVNNSSAFASYPASTFSTLTPDTANVTGSKAGNPRSILNERYQKNYNRSFTKSDFVSITDTSNGDHIPHFTSVFVCPESGECFMSGDLIDGELVIATKGMNWYITKKIAEFAAAGRAEDNFSFRSLERTTTSSRFCNERPYVAHNDDISSFLEWDSRTREKVDRLKQKAAQRSK